MAEIGSVTVAVKVEPAQEFEHSCTRPRVREGPGRADRPMTEADGSATSADASSNLDSIRSSEEMECFITAQTAGARWWANERNFVPSPSPRILRGRGHSPFHCERIHRGCRKPRSQMEEDAYAALLAMRSPLVGASLFRARRSVLLVSCSRRGRRADVGSNSEGSACGQRARRAILPIRLRRPRA